MKRLGHILRRVISVTVVILVLLVGGAVAFARTEYANRWLREEVIRVLHEDFGLEASFEEVEFEWLPPRIHVVRTEVTGSDGRPLVVVDRITIGLQPAALLQGRIEFSEITLEEPEINLIVEGRRVINLPQLRRSGDDDDSGGGQKIGDMGVLAGRVNLEIRDAPGGPVHLLLDDTNLDLTLDTEGATDVRLLISSGSLRQGEVTYEIGLIQARIMVRDGQALLRGVRLRLGDLRLEVTRATAGISAPFDVEGHLELELPLEMIRDFPVSVPLLEGSINLTADVTRRDGQLSVQGSLDAEDVIIGPEFIGSDHTLGPHPIGDVQAQFHYEPDRVTASEVTIVRPAEGDGRLIVRNLSVGLRAEGMPIAGQVEFDQVELAHIIIDAGLYASRVRALISGETTMEGNLLGGFRLRFRPLQLQLHNFQTLSTSILKDDGDLIIGIPNSSVQGKVVVDNDGVHLNNMIVSLGRSVLNVEALLGIRSPTRWWLRASTPEGGELHLEDVGPIAGLAMEGHGAVSAHIQGTYGDPSIEGRLDLRDYSIADIPLGHVRGALRYRGLVISLPQVQGEVGQSTYQFTEGRVDFRNGVRLDGLALLEPFFISQAVDMFNVEGAAREAEGMLRGQARISYTSRSNRWLVDVTGALSGATYSGFGVGDGEVDVGYDTGDITVHRVALRRRGGEALVRGTLSRHSELDMDVDIRGLPLSAIEPLPEQIRSIEGDLRGRVSLRGTTAFPRATGRIELSPMIYRGTRFMPSRVNFDLQGDELLLDGGLGGRLLRIEELRVHLTAPYPLWIRGTIRGLRLADLLGPGVLPEGLSIRLDATLDGGIEAGRLADASGTTIHTPQGEVTIWGAAQRDLGMSGWVRIDTLEVDHPAVTIRNLAAVPIDLAQDRVVFRQVSDFSVYSPTLRQSTTVSLGGWASMENLGLEMSGALDLAFVPALIDDVAEISGRLTVREASISGSIREPALLGEASFDISRLVLAGLESYPADDLRGRLRFSRNVVILEDVAARVLGGQVEGDGRVTLDGLSLGAYHLQWRFRDAFLSLGPRSSAVVNGSVALDSPASEGGLPLAGGRIEVVRLRYEEPIELFSADLNGVSRTRRTEVQTYDQGSDVIRLDLQLTGADNLRIANNLARTDLIIDDTAQPFRLIGTNQYQTARGTVRMTPHGALSFRDNQFDIDRGILVFTDPFEINPSIDLVATAMRRDWVITLRVTGTLNEPRISLTSEPELAEADITLLLTVGLTREETEQMGYLSAASSAIPELLWSLSGVDDEVNRVLSVDGERPMFDEFRITTDYSRRTGRPEPRIRIARRLTDSIRLGASAGLAETRDFEANLEVDLPMVSEGLSFDVAYENDTSFNLGNIGGDLRWRLEF
jgi:translocation and assembly module TamB